MKTCIFEAANTDFYDTIADITGLYEVKCKKCNRPWFVAKKPKGEVALKFGGAGNKCLKDLV